MNRYLSRGACLERFGMRVYGELFHAMVSAKSSSPIVSGHKYVVWQGPVYYFPPERSGLREYGWGWSTSLSEEKGAESHHTSIAL